MVSQGMQEKRDFEEKPIRCRNEKNVMLVGILNSQQICSVPGKYFQVNSCGINLSKTVCVNVFYHPVNIAHKRAGSAGAGGHE